MMTDQEINDFERQEICEAKANPKLAVGMLVAVYNRYNEFKAYGIVKKMYFSYDWVDYMVEVETNSKLLTTRAQRCDQVKMRMLRRVI